MGLCPFAPQSGLTLQTAFAHSEKPCASTQFSWENFWSFWSPELGCRKSDTPEAAMLWGSPGHKERPQPTVGINHQTCDWRCFQMIPVSRPFKSCPAIFSAGLRHHGTETSHPHCVQSKFLTHRMCGHHEMVVLAAELRTVCYAALEAGKQMIHPVMKPKQKTHRFLLLGFQEHPCFLFCWKPGCTALCSCLSTNLHLSKLGPRILTMQPCWPWGAVNIRVEVTNRPGGSESGGSTNLGILSS